MVQTSELVLANTPSTVKRGDTIILEGSGTPDTTLTITSQQSIGTISRLLKEIAVDCQLTDYQHEVNHSYIKKLTKKNTVKQELSSDDIIINYPLGNKDNSIICDFMECDFKCSTRKREYDKKDTYNYDFYH